MDSDQIYSILLFFVCVVISAFFSSSETAFTSLRKAKLKLKVKEGDKKAKKTLDLSNKYDNLLSTILIGNNLVNIASSSIATIFFVNIFPRYGALISTIVTTILLLFLAEITPKLIAKIAPEKIAMSFTKPLNFVMVLFKPLVWIVSLWRNLIMNIIPDVEETSLSEDELLSYVDEAKVDGSIEDDEHVLVKAAIEFDDVSVESILVPRIDIAGFEIEDSDEEIEELFDETSYSRLIVYEDTVDKVLGIVHERDFHRYIRKKRLENNDQNIMSIISDIIYIPGLLKLSEALKLMQKEKKHMAAIIDEHGGLEGIVTMEDILEELVGEIWDESDDVEQDIKIIERNKSIEVNGRTSIDKVFKFLNIPLSEDYNSNTIGGFVVEMLDKMPRFEDSFIFENYKFIVKKVESNRVDKILIRYLNNK